MIASDLAHLYLALRDGETPDRVMQALEERLGALGWNGRIQKGPPPPRSFPPLPGPHVGLVFVPPPTAEQFSDAVRTIHGMGRSACVPTLDAFLLHWHWAGTDRAFPGQGLSLYGVFDTSLPLPGPLFALVPGIPPTPLFFGPPERFAQLLRAQAATDRGHALILERVELDRKDGPARGPPLQGTLPADAAPPGSVWIVVSGMDGAVRVIPQAFVDLAHARKALHSASETAVVLYARLVERVPLG